MFMLLLDITVVNVALPDIQRSLHSSFHDLQWVVNAYSLTLAAFLLTAGALPGPFGRRPAFLCRAVVVSLSPAAWWPPGFPLPPHPALAAVGTGGARTFSASLAPIAQR